MSWFGLDSLLLGVDLSAEKERSDKTDAALIRTYQEHLDSGAYTQEDFDKRINALNNSNLQSGASDPEHAVNSEFKAGLNEGIGNIGHAIQSTANFSLGTVFKLIPWQAWIALGIFLFIYLGGLKGILKK